MGSGYSSVLLLLVPLVVATVGMPVITRMASGRSMVWVSLSSETNLIRLSMKSVP